MKLQERLLADADEMEACGAGNEARTMRKAAAQLDLYEAALREIAEDNYEPDRWDSETESFTAAAARIARTALNPTDTGA